MPNIRSEFSRPAIVAPEEFEWVASPGGEVERVMLDRIGDEVAVATSLVRYPPDSRFPAHEHGLGEEYLVLEGEFADEHGRYPPGTYVRNPPGTRHSPYSDPGCVIWVKLRQFHPDVGHPLTSSIDIPLPETGMSVRELYCYRDEVVRVVAAADAVEIFIPPAEQVQELFIVNGGVTYCGRHFAEWAWLRLPPNQGAELITAGASRILHKTRPAYAIPV